MRAYNGTNDNSSADLKKVFKQGKLNSLWISDVTIPPRAFHQKHIKS